MARDGSFAIGDADLVQTKALPASAGDASTTAFDLGAAQANQDFLADCEMLVSAPALTTTQMPDTKTATYKVEESADNITFATLLAAVISQVGAAGAGAAAATKRIRLPVNVKRYARLTVTTGAAAGDCSGATMSVALKF